MVYYAKVTVFPLVLLKTCLRPVMTAWLGSHRGRLVFSVIHAFYYIALFPLLLKFIGKRDIFARP